MGTKILTRIIILFLATTYSIIPYTILASNEEVHDSISAQVSFDEGTSHIDYYSNRSYFGDDLEGYLNKCDYSARHRISELVMSLENRDEVLDNLWTRQCLDESFLIGLLISLKNVERTTFSDFSRIYSILVATRLKLTTWKTEAKYLFHDINKLTLIERPVTISTENKRTLNLMISSYSNGAILIGYLDEKSLSGAFKKVYRRLRIMEDDSGVVWLNPVAIARQIKSGSSSLETEKKRDSFFRENGIDRGFEFRSVQIWKKGRLEETPEVEMPLYEGTLRTLPEEPVREKIKRFIALAQEVIQFHKLGMIHNDIKPGNVLYRNNEVALNDFDLATSLEAIEKKWANDRRIVKLSGTYSYMAPEALDKQKYLDPVSNSAEIDDFEAYLELQQKRDVYSYGKTLHELLNSRTDSSSDRSKDSSGTNQDFDGFNLREKCPDLSDEPECAKTFSETFYSAYERHLKKLLNSYGRDYKHNPCYLLREIIRDAINPDPKQRPTMDEVKIRLESLDNGSLNAPYCE